MKEPVAKEHYCQTCDHFRPSHIEEREETFAAFGAEIKVRGDVRVCDVCNEVMGDEEFDGLLLKKVHKILAERGIPRGER